MKQSNNKNRTGQRIKVKVFSFCLALVLLVGFSYAAFATGADEGTGVDVVEEIELIENDTQQEETLLENEEQEETSDADLEEEEEEQEQEETSDADLEETEEEQKEDLEETGDGNDDVDGAVPPSIDENTDKTDTLPQAGTADADAGAFTSFAAAGFEAAGLDTFEPNDYMTLSVDGSVTSMPASTGTAVISATVNYSYTGTNLAAGAVLKMQINGSGKLYGGNITYDATYVASHTYDPTTQTATFILKEIQAGQAFTVALPVEASLMAQTDETIYATTWLESGLATDGEDFAGVTPVNGGTITLTDSRSTQFVGAGQFDYEATSKDQTIMLGSTINHGGIKKIDGAVFTAFQDLTLVYRYEDERSPLVLRPETVYQRSVGSSLNNEGFPFLLTDSTDENNMPVYTVNFGQLEMNNNNYMRWFRVPDSGTELAVGDVFTCDVDVYDYGVSTTVPITTITYTITITNPNISFSRRSYNRLSAGTADFDQTVAAILGDAYTGGIEGQTYTTMTVSIPDGFKVTGLSSTNGYNLSVRYDQISYTVAGSDTPKTVTTSSVRYNSLTGETQQITSITFVGKQAASFTNYTDARIYGYVPSGAGAHGDKYDFTYKFTYSDEDVTDQPATDGGGFVNGLKTVTLTMADRSASKAVIAPAVVNIDNKDFDSVAQLPGNTVTKELRLGISSAVDAIQDPFVYVRLPNGVSVSQSANIFGPVRDWQQTSFSTLTMRDFQGYYPLAVRADSVKSVDLGDGTTLHYWRIKDKDVTGYGSGSMLRVKLDFTIGSMAAGNDYILDSGFGSWVNNSYTVDTANSATGYSMISTPSYLTAAGVTATQVFGRSQTWEVAGSVGVAATVAVKGNQDTDYGTSGESVPGGGSTMYKIVIENTGSSALQNFELIDIFPYAGDTNIINSGARNSEFRVNVANNITVSATGSDITSADVELTFANTSAPARFNVSGADVAGSAWSASFDSATTRALRLTLKNGKRITPGTRLEIIIEGTLPGDMTERDGESAINSIAYRYYDGTKWLASEPSYAGLTATAPENNNSLGGRVFLDANRNATMDTSEVGLNDPTLYLYKKVDGAWTYTDRSMPAANNANEERGHFIFGNLDNGTYGVQIGFADGVEGSFVTAGTGAYNLVAVEGDATRAWVTDGTDNYSFVLLDTANGNTGTQISNLLAPVYVPTVVTGQLLFVNTDGNEVSSAVAYTQGITVALLDGATPVSGVSATVASDGSYTLQGDNIQTKAYTVSATLPSGSKLAFYSGANTSAVNAVQGVTVTAGDIKVTDTVAPTLTGVTFSNPSPVGSVYNYGNAAIAASDNLSAAGKLAISWQIVDASDDADVSGAGMSGTGTSIAIPTALITGSYYISVSITDEAGNITTGDSAEFDILRTEPTVTASDKTHEVNKSSADPALATLIGATATDALGTSLTVSYANKDTSNPVNFKVPGVYVVTVSATDAGGNTATKDVNVTVTDTTPPTLSVNTPLTFELNDGPANFDAFVALAVQSVSDNCSADANITIEQTGYENVNYGSAGSYTVSLQGKDEAGNRSTAQTVTILVEEEGWVVDPVNEEAIYAEGFEVYAMDVADLDLAAYILAASAQAKTTATPSAPVTVTKVNETGKGDYSDGSSGSYTITFETAKGTTSNAVTVTVAADPVITLGSAAPYVWEYGDTLPTESDLLAHFDPSASNKDGSGITSFSIEMPTRAEFEDSLRNITVTIKALVDNGKYVTINATIIVADTTPPALTTQAVYYVQGNGPASASAFYADAVAAVTDNYDAAGDIIITNGAGADGVAFSGIDFDTPAVYTTYLTATDSSNNSCTPVAVTVEVLDDSWTIDPETLQAIYAEDFSIYSMDVGRLQAADYITLASAVAFELDDTRTPVQVTGGNFSALSATPDTYTVTFTTAAGTTSRDVTVTVVADPVIALENTIYYHEYGSAAPTADDLLTHFAPSASNKDSSAVVHSITSNTQYNTALGNTTETISGVLDNGQTISAEVTVVVRDTTAPSLTVDGFYYYQQTVSAAQFLQDVNATATDNYDAPADIALQNNFNAVDFTKPGTYTVTITPVDSQANRGESKTVRVYVLEQAWVLNRANAEAVYAEPFDTYVLDVPGLTNEQYIQLAAARAIRLDMDKTELSITSVSSDIKAVVDRYSMTFGTQAGSTATVVATVKLDNFVVTFDYNGAGPETYQTVGYGTLVTRPATPELANHVLLGWADETGKLWNFAADTMPARNITLTAQWKQTEFVVYYYADGSLMHQQYVAAGSKVPYMNGTAVTGWNFACWVLGEDQAKVWNFEDPMPEHDLTLVAFYTKAEEVTSSSSSSGGSGSSSNSSSSSSSTSDSSSSSTSDSSVISQTGDTGTTSTTGGGTVVSSTTGTSTPLSGTTTPSQVIEQENVAPELDGISRILQNIQDGEPPLANVFREGEWSVMSLLLAILNLVLAAAMLIHAIGKGKNGRKAGTALKVVSALLGVVGVVLFLGTNDLGTVSVSANFSTTLLTVLLVVQAVVGIIGIRATRTPTYEEDV